VFFPLMKSLDFEGFTSIVYEPPNNWENRIGAPIFLYALWPSGGTWKTHLLFQLTRGESVVITSSDLPAGALESSLALIYPSACELKSELMELPSKKTWVSHTPPWRNTSGFRSPTAQTSYQAEIEPFPEKATLLTFHPFIQFGAVHNFLLTLNVTRLPDVISKTLMIMDSRSKTMLDKIEVHTNSLTTIPLDKYGFRPDDLPIFYSPDMAAIPFGLGVSLDGKMLSLEHTHPPASLVLFGERNKVQGMIKRNWIESFK